MPEELLNYKQVMARTGLAKSRVYEMLATGELAGHRIGRKRVFYASGVSAAVERGRNAPVPAPEPPPPPAKRSNRDGRSWLFADLR